MKAPYKYPYISIFIIGYYLLEHQGYYYKLRKYLGYKEIDEIDYVVHLNKEKYHKLSVGADRKLLLHCFNNGKEEDQANFNRAAMSAKEKRRSPVIFSDMDCSAHTEFCESLTKSYPSILFIQNQQVVKEFNGPIVKKKILKLIKEQDK